MGGVAAMGQLWSTVDDLCRLASFLAGGGDGILERASLDQMWTPQVMLDPERWSVGWGIGIELTAQEGRVFGGHGGAMPGFLAGLHVHRESGVGAAVLTNSATRLATRELCLELAGATIERWPAEIAPWRPEPEPPPEVRAILGRWWSEGNEFVFVWRDGKLTAELPGAPPWVHPSVFEPLPGGGYRVVSGRERGERLRVDGQRLLFGGYPFTRTQTSSPG
jgi:CubicO group peptidase (beta-lactamase class C family)